MESSHTSLQMRSSNVFTSSCIQTIAATRTSELPPNLSLVAKLIGTICEILKDVQWGARPRSGFKEHRQQRGSPPSQRFHAEHGKGDKEKLATFSEVGGAYVPGVPTFFRYTLVTSAPGRSFALRYSSNRPVGTYTQDTSKNSCHISY